MIGMACVLLIVNLFDLDALAHMASAIFLITYLAVHVATAADSRDERLQTDRGRGFSQHGRGARYFFLSTLLTQPWSNGIDCSVSRVQLGVEMILAPKGTTSNPAKTVPSMPLPPRPT